MTTQKMLELAAKVEAATGPNRKKDRSRTYEGIAAAMAAQWGGETERLAA